MKILNIANRHSVILSKLQNPNIKNVFKFKTHYSFPQSHLIYNSCSNKNGGKFTVSLSYTTTRGTGMTVSCKLKTSKNDSNKKSKNKSLQTKIVVPELDGAPALSEAAEEGGSAGDRSVPVNPPPPPSKKSGLGLLKGLPRRVLSVLSNLPLAIAEMFAVAALMALGTIIDQGEAPDYYFQKYPEDNPAFGFFTWRWVLTLGFDRMFSSPVFLGTLALLGASLMACTYTTQIPVVKVAKRWSFLHSEAIRRQEYSDTLPRASLQDLGIILVGAGYEV